MHLGALVAPIVTERFNKKTTAIAEDDVFDDFLLGLRELISEQDESADRVAATNRGEEHKDDVLACGGVQMRHP